MIFVFFKVLGFYEESSSRNGCMNCYGIIIFLKLYRIVMLEKVFY